MSVVAISAFGWLVACFLSSGVGHLRGPVVVVTSGQPRRYGDRHVQHMQKALDQMNLQLHHVISDITGTNGLAFSTRFWTGIEMYMHRPALCDPRLRASHETIAKSLVGDHRREHLFTLGQSVTLYREYQRESPPARKRCRY
jgi:hypothetical protein